MSGGISAVEYSLCLLDLWTHKGHSHKSLKSKAEKSCFALSIDNETAEAADGTDGAGLFSACRRHRADVWNELN